MGLKKVFNKIVAIDIPGFPEGTTPEEFKQAISNSKMNLKKSLNKLAQAEENDFPGDIVDDGDGNVLDISPVSPKEPIEEEETPAEVYGKCMKAAKNSKDYCKNMCQRAYDSWGLGEYFWAFTLMPFKDKFKEADKELHMCSCGCECQQCEDERLCAIELGVSDALIVTAYEQCRRKHFRGWEQGPDDDNGNPTQMTCTQACQSTLVVQA